MIKIKHLNSYSTLAILFATLSSPVSAVKETDSSSSSSSTSTTQHVLGAEAENNFSVLSDEMIVEIFSHHPDFLVEKQNELCKRFARIAKDNSLKFNAPSTIRTKIDAIENLDLKKVFLTFANSRQNYQTWRDMNFALAPENLTLLKESGQYVFLPGLKNHMLAMKIARHAKVFFIKKETHLDHRSDNFDAITLLSTQQIEALAQAKLFTPKNSDEPSNEVSLIIQLSALSAAQITAFASSQFFINMANFVGLNLEDFILQLATWSPEKIVAFGEWEVLENVIAIEYPIKIARALCHKTAEDIQHFKKVLDTFVDKAVPIYLQSMVIEAMAKLENEQLPAFAASFTELSKDSFLKTTRPDHRYPLLAVLMNNYKTHQERVDFLTAIKGTALIHSPAQRAPDNRSVTELMNLTNTLNQNDDDDTSSLLTNFNAMLTVVNNIDTHSGGQEALETIHALAENKNTPAEVAAFIEAAYAATADSAVLGNHFSRNRLIQKMAASNIDPTNMQAILAALSQHAQVLFGTTDSEKLLNELLKLTPGQIDLVATSPKFTTTTQKFLGGHHVVAKVIAEQHVPEDELTSRLNVIEKFRVHCTAYQESDLISELITKSSQELTNFYNMLFNKRSGIINPHLTNYVKGNKILELIKHKKSDIELAVFLLNHHINKNTFTRFPDQKLDILAHILGMPESEVVRLFEHAYPLSVFNVYGYENYIRQHTHLWKMRNSIK